jgi:DNA-binding CsgD family transcriptional regulator
LKHGDLERLRLLARGVHVSEMARRQGYSERAMFRLLGELFRRMRVRNRHEAVVLAARWGLLDSDESRHSRKAG